MTPEEQTAAGVGTIRHAPTGATWITWRAGEQPPWEVIADTVKRLTGTTVTMRDASSPDEPDRSAVAVYTVLPPDEDDR